MPAGPEQRRRTAIAQSALLDTATERLIVNAIDALASQITPSVLARSTGIVSVDTAYRMLDSAEHTLQMLTNRAFSQDFTSDELHWPRSSDVVLSVIDAMSEEGPTPGIRRALRQLLLRNLELPAVALGRLIDGATLTASDSWNGELQIRDERLAIARQIRSVRLHMVRSLDEELELLLRVVLGQLRRRPKPGVTVARIVSLLHGLADGMVGRMLLDADSTAVDDIVDAMMELGHALTEDGFLLGGATPEEEELRQRYDIVLASAERHWRAGHTIDSLELLAMELSLPLEDLTALFPSVEDLADALLRTIIIDSELTGSRDTRLALLTASLHRLAQVVDELPEVLALDRALGAEHSVLVHLRDVAADLAATSVDRSVRSDRFGDQVVASACAGLGHWETTRMLIDLVRTRGHES